MEKLKLTVRAVVAANRIFNDVTEGQIHRACRNRWAVALKRTGRTYYSCDGKRILSDAHHPVILPKGSCYSWQCQEAGECLLIEFDADETLQTILPFTINDPSFVEKAFWEISAALPLPGIEAHLSCMHTLYGLVLTLLRSVPKEYSPKKVQQLLAPALEYMSAHYDDSAITNDFLAGLCGISTVYFRKRFEAAYGKSPIRYLHQLRIRHARDLLESDYDSITRVAESVGYSGVYHFSKMFKLYTGKSPTDHAKDTRR